MGVPKTPQPPDKNYKRRRVENPHSSPPSSSPEVMNRKNEQMIPRFLTIIRTGEESFAKVSPFFIHKSITGFIGNVKMIKKTRDGALLVEVLTDVQAKKLLTCKSLCNNIEVEVAPHNKLNKSQGIIRCYDLDAVSIEEIKNELSDQKVIDVFRFTYKKGNEIKNTHTYLLTFGSPIVPKEIKVGYLNVPVKTYYPNPTRCTRCLQFGHSKNRCSKPITCSWCSNEKHEGECTTKVMCAVCKGPHNAFDKACPTYVIEKEIKKIQVDNRVPYGFAKRKFYENTPRNLIAKTPNYSEVLTRSFGRKPSTLDKEIQTDFTPENKCFNFNNNKQFLKQKETKLEVHPPTPTTTARPPSPLSSLHVPLPTSNSPSSSRSSSPASRLPLPPSPTPQERPRSGSFNLDNNKSSTISVKQAITNKTLQGHNNKSTKLNKKNKKLEMDNKYENMEVELHNFPKNDGN